MPSHSYDVLARLRPPVPAGLVERAEGWTPESVPSVAAPAASVILLRDSEQGLQTYLLHRHALMVGLTRPMVRAVSIRFIAARFVRPLKRPVSS
jgi:hypothetical protein